jgi:methionine-rich copper-binding protein CopC
VKSEPSDKAVVTARPASVRLWFSAVPEMRYTSVTLKNAAGAAVELAKAHQDSTSQSLVVAEVKGTLPPGKYAVTWRTVSRDGHPVKGEFSFELTSGNKAD